MTCVSIETFHLWRFIVSLIVDPFTPLRGCMPQKGKQGFSFKEHCSWVMEMLSLTKTRSLWIFFWQVLVWNPLSENFQDTSAISIRLYHWHLFFSSFVNKLLQAYMRYIFLKPFFTTYNFDFNSSWSLLSCSCSWEGPNTPIHQSFSPQLPCLW